MMKLLRPLRQGRNQQLPQVIAIAAGSLSSLSCGLSFAWTSPTIPKLITDPSLNISLDAASYFTMISAVSMGIASMIYPALIHKIGTKMVILFTATVQLVSWILVGASNNIWILYLARVMSGISDAGVFGVVPIYICEIAEPKIRGTWGTIVATNVYLGIFVINAIGSYCSVKTTALICGSVPLIQIGLFMLIPESPYYLLAKNKKKAAKRSLQLLRWRTDVDDELSRLECDVLRQVSESGKIRDLFIIDSNKKALIICFGLRTAQQFSGLSAFEIYTQYMFEESGGITSAKVSALIFSGLLMISVTVSAFVVERLQRKTLMMFSCFGSAFSLGIESIYFSLKHFTDIDLSFLNWLPLTGMLSYIIICASGLGIIPTLVLGEMFSASIKNKAALIMNLCLALYFLIIPKLFQSITYNFDIFYSILFFTVCCICGGIFSYFCVIETKGKTLEEIQQELKGILPQSVTITT